MRTLTIVRTLGRYRDSYIVCDQCATRFNPSYHYDIYDGFDKLNVYPFHTRTCAKKWANRTITGKPFTWEYIASGKKFLFQEESTED